MERQHRAMAPRIPTKKIAERESKKPGGQYRHSSKWSDLKGLRRLQRLYFVNPYKWRGNCIIYRTDAAVCCLLEVESLLGTKPKCHCFDHCYLG